MGKIDGSRCKDVAGVIRPMFTGLNDLVDADAAWDGSFCEVSFGG